MNPTSTRRIKTFILLALGAVILLLATLYYLSFQKVTVVYDAAIISNITLYRTAGANSFVTVGKPLRTVSSEQNFKLRNGSYLLRPTGTKSSNIDVIFSVSSNAVVKNLDFDYSTVYLSELLAPQQVSINQTIYASNTVLPKLYKANPGYLYHHGEWYGTTLSYIGTDTLSRDTLRLVMHKTNNSWKVITNPPQIVLSAQNNQSIPASVLRAVNMIDIGTPTINGK